MYKLIKTTIVLAVLISPIYLLAQPDSELLDDLQLNATQDDSVSSLPVKSPDLEDSDVKMFIDKIEVIGQLERPQALFILPGSTPDIDDIQIEHSFFKEIFRPVEKRGRIQTKITTDQSKDRKDYIPW